jgi:hypothetical protein
VCRPEPLAVPLLLAATASLSGAFQWPASASTTLAGWSIQARVLLGAGGGNHWLEQPPVHRIR